MSYFVYIIEREREKEDPNDDNSVGRSDTLC